MSEASGGWTSRKWWWSIGAIVLGLAVFVGAMVQQYKQRWTFLQREYFWPYVQTHTRPFPTGEYQLLYRVDAKGRRRRPAVNEDLSDPDVQQGKAKLEWSSGTLNNERVRAWLKEAIYGGRSPWRKLGDDWWLGVVAGGAGLCYAVPADRRRSRRRTEGRRLRGPERLTPAEFNERNALKYEGGLWVAWYRRLRGQAREWRGVYFVGESPRGRKDKPVVFIPHESESSHFLIMGDTKSGKSTLIRQLLMQIRSRGETAIVYDPALEYIKEFYVPEDVVLNPRDMRMPYWTPGNEVRSGDEAEAYAISKSLFPDRPRGEGSQFFSETSRNLFSFLLTLNPTVEELTSWLSRSEEIDRRVKDTDLEMSITPTAPQQRAGVLASFNAVARALKLLPPKSETTGTWTATEWSKDPRGWIFLSSTPTIREALRPLTSLWLDTLILRLMTEGILNPSKGRVWLVIDELHSLQKLPQLHTAATENRKSNSPLVLGFQGRSQIEELYGRVAEAMLSQPATRIFLRTAEPDAAEWISKSLGEMEIERVRESRTDGRFPTTDRHSRSDMMERPDKKLVTGSEIMGLPDMQGYLKSGNYVVPISVYRPSLPEKLQPQIIERPLKPASPPPVPAKSAPAAPARPEDAQPKPTASDGNEPKPFRFEFEDD